MAGVAGTSGAAGTMAGVAGTSCVGSLGAGLCPVCEGRSTQFFWWNRSGRVPGSRKNYRQNLDNGH